MIRFPRLFLNISFLFATAMIPVASLGEIPFRVPVVPDSTPVNAMWSYENAIFMMWLYGEKSSCPETRRTADATLFIWPGTPPADQDWKHMVTGEIPMCLLMTRNGEPVSCRSGTLNFEYLGAKKEYRGEYEFELSNGAKMAGAFRAHYCPIGN